MYIGNFIVVVKMYIAKLEPGVYPEPSIAASFSGPIARMMIPKNTNITIAADT